MLTVSSALSQFSGYTSIGFGYHANPLYNYARISDQLKTGYLELAYQKESDNSTTDLRYVGGLMLFNRLLDRNYYEHRLTGITTFHFPPPPEETGEEEEDEEETEKPASYADSTGQYISLGARISARHDREVHRDFDNRGAEVRAAYRTPLGERSFLRLQNMFSYHAYPSVRELSNWNNVLTAQLAGWTEGNMLYGITVSGGVKYYTTSVFDTTRFQSTTTATPGKGKGGGNQGGTTTEEILLQPQINGTVQITAGMFFRQEWSPQSSFSAVALYRLTPRYAERYLAPLTPEASLTEDLYADFFSTRGPEIELRLYQPLFARIQAIVGFEFQYKTYGIPALDLDGFELDPKRTDLRSSLELYFSRYFEIVDGLGTDVAVGVEVTRNQSNDRYNDFSVSSISLGIGIGF